MLQQQLENKHWKYIYDLTEITKQKFSNTAGNSHFKDYYLLKHNMGILEGIKLPKTAATLFNRKAHIRED